MNTESGREIEGGRYASYAVKLVPWLAVGTRRDRHGGRTGISDDLHKIATVTNI